MAGARASRGLELTEPEEQDPQAEDGQHPASEDHEIRPYLLHGVDVRLGQPRNEESGFVCPLPDQVAVAHILGCGILAARPGDVVFVIRQDAALGEAVPAGGGEGAIIRYRRPSGDSAKAGDPDAVWESRSWDRLSLLAPAIW